MYILLSGILLLFLLFFLVSHHRKKKLICRISNMPFSEKCGLLNLLIEPFGYCYDPGQDLFSTRIDAWQKSFGYGHIYDLAAPSMNMIFDTEPVYFNYQKKTWLIQFWKGQYGINTGAEAGIYHADTVIPPALRKQTLFHAADEEEMLPIRIRLRTGRQLLFCYAKTHWWLTGFITGRWNPPSDLAAEFTITFPTTEMCAAFLRSFTALGYKAQDYCLEDTTVRFLFTTPKTTPPVSGNSWLIRYILWKTRMLCRFYQKITSPFCYNIDRILYLYYYLPPVFRKTVCPRRFKKHRRKHP